SGKTTCKEMLASVLEALGAGHKSAGNFNNMIGVPLTLFGLKPEHQWSVVEMGMSARGEISRLAQMASPQLGIITNVGHGHLESLGGISGVARAKGELFINLPREGVALVNIDDHEVKQLPVANGVRRVTFGGALEADIRAERIGAENGLAVFTLVLAGKGYPVRLPMPGRHNVSNALAAAAAAFELGVAPEAIVAGLESFRPIPGRMELVQLGDDIVILEDSYNANPLSVRAALDAVHDFRPSGRHIAVLGDMLELGAAAAELHQDIGAMAATRVDWLLTLGQHAGETARGALDAGMPQERVIVSADHEQLSTLLKDLVQAGDQLLIKGSRGMRMEQITASLRASHGDVTTVRA
ncbi:MAG: UDP-N-acetylmuramoyl-tripeptide--D-alanyl-D-alanine ligase, partial [Desulfuromonadales bacterium]|nr:UDP-N-acetylmuramoyl-tripeptide--D-alanyl-D-alanine ligase [Desulfuromonadales bacterium]